ncbi:MAG TPA: N-acetylmuramoyl-L-alanine amidase [Chitinophagaceae bacterium]|nr:N-acetylmuramoyl-L-alanine amidase [Chitinophagaceae bacterium]
MKLLFIFLSLLISCSLKAQSVPGSQMFKTIGALPYMEYGLGDDRLGGAKMGYLDSNVVIRVVDSVNGDYKVQLSSRHAAYMPKTSVKPAPEILPRNYYLSSSFKVYGDSAFDYVSVSMEEKLPYRSQQTIEPAGIMVDLFGITSNTNWITQLGTAKEIENTWYEQLEDDVMRIHIRLKHNRHWGHSIFYDSLSNRLFIRVKRPPNADVKKWRIAIDAGHGGTNTGASGTTTKVLEKDYTLLMAKELEKTFKKAGMKHVFMTRTIDTTLSMEERILMLRKENPDILISMHLNSSAVDTIRGTSTFYRYVGFRPLTQAVLKRMLETGLKEYGNVGSFNFALSGPTDYPNCLVEVAFLSNPGDEKKIVDPKFHKLVAKKIVEGVKDYGKK